MTRRFLDDIKADREALLAQSTPITKVQKLALDQDSDDSTIQDECTINSSVTVSGVDITSSWSKVNNNVYTSEKGGDAEFLKPSFANGEIQTALTAGFTYIVGAQVSFEGDNNDRYDFTILKNGLPVGNFASGTALGNDDPVSLNVRLYENSAESNATYSLGVRSFNEVDQIDVISCVLYAVIQPTRNA